MKKIISVFILFALALSLCACSEATAGIADAWESGMNGTASLTLPKEESKEPTIEIPHDAIRLNVAFGPEFEVVMTHYLRILTVIPANAEAEALLAGLELTNRSYIFAFDEVLAAAQEQGYLQIGKNIKMTADSLDASVWHNASKELLMRPVDAFRLETGALFGCHLFLPDSAPDQFDTSLYTKVERTTDEYHEVYYPTGAVSGHTTWRSVQTYPDGKILEWYSLAIKGGSVSLTWNPDGMCQYDQNADNGRNEVWEGPNSSGYRDIKAQIDPNTYNYIFESASGFEIWEGAGYYFEHTYYPDGTFAKSIKEYLDGSYERAVFFENGEFQEKEYRGADGTYERVVFFENGELQEREFQGTDGVYEREVFFENGELQEREFRGADGTYDKMVCFENGEVQEREFQGTDGVYERVVFFENGELQEREFRGTDGMYERAVFFENGELQEREIQGTDGMYEREVYFENGELQEREFRGTDGVYEGMAYYTNGKLERLKRETPEGYYEEQRREDGKLVYMKLADAGMTNVREAFYTEGKPVKVIIDGVVHEDWETLSQFS